MAISTISQKGLDAPITLTSPVLTTPVVTGGSFSSPTMTTPALGTPSALVLTNATGLPKAALPSGSTLQCITATYGTQQTSTSSTYADSGLTVSITPSSTSSRILVMVFQPYSVGSPGGRDETAMSISLQRNGTQIAETQGWITAYGPGGAKTLRGQHSISWVDSPSTTSAITYKTQFKVYDNFNTGVINLYPSSITVMEIAG